ncbi:MAG: hypothetical protein ABH805_00650 [Candidatus Nealsonbacteria bacterium]
MPSIKESVTIKELQDFTEQVYGLKNDRYFSLNDMLTNIERFTMRGLKGIRKDNQEKTKLNLLIAISWFSSIMNRLHIDLSQVVWKRFPYLCSYCGYLPCSCQKEKIKKRQNISVSSNDKKPKTLADYQKMFQEIYPSQTRTLEHAGVHLAEEMGEFSEAILTYRGRHKDSDFKSIEFEAADLFSCFMGVFNSLGISIAREFSVMFSENCHVCKKAPCVCDFTSITEFKS